MGVIIFFQRFISSIVHRYQLTDDLLDNVTSSHMSAYRFPGSSNVLSSTIKLES